MTDPIVPVSRSDQAVAPVDLPRLTPLQREQERRRREREREKRRGARPDTPPQTGGGRLDIRA